MTYEAKLANIITRLKEVKEKHPEYTNQKIADHTGVSPATVARIFADGSENQNFRYDSIKPIAKMLLDLDSLDAGEDDEKALKAIIQFKEAAIQDLEQQLIAQKEKYETKLEKEREQYRASLDFLKHQIELKDDRITRLMTSLEKRGELYENLFQQFLSATTQTRKSEISKSLKTGHLDED